MSSEVAHHQEAFPTLSRGRTIHDYLRILLRRRWVVLAVFLVGLGIAAYQTFTATPIYTATVQVLIERHLPRVLDTSQGPQYDAYSEEFYQTQYKLLESLALAKKVAEKLQLHNHPNFSGMFSKLPPDADPSVKQRTEENLVRAVRGGLSVMPVKTSRLVDLKYSHPDPKFAAEVANAYAQCFIEQSLDLRFAISQETGNWLQKKLIEARKKLEDSEAKLNRYKKDQNIVALEGKETITVQKLEQLNKDLVTAQTRRMEAETRVNQVSQGNAIPELLNNPLIQTLKGAEARIVAQLSELGKKFGDKHPRMIQLHNELAATRSNIGAEMAKVTQSIKNEYAMAQNQEANLQKALQGVKGETQDLSDRAIQYRVLLRDVETNRALYENILKNLKETTTIENVPATNIRIVYPASVPTAPVSPQKSRHLLMGAALGLFFGFALALVLENLDTTIKTPEEAETRLGIPNLAVIPHLQVAPDNASDGYPTLFSRPGSQPLAAEAYRSLRTSILFSTPGHAPKTLLVTSSFPLEGKTLTAVNLASVMAKAESDILLIDADLRRPSLHKLFNVPQEPGLTNYLVGDIDVVPAVPTQVPHLFLVPCGHIPPNPSELVGSESMQAFLATTLAQFARVIIDSPPLLSVTDPTILATQVEGVLLVVKAETVPRRAAMDSKDQLLGVRAHLLGTLINDVSMRRDGYYYRHYYRYHHHYSDDGDAHAQKSGTRPGVPRLPGVWSRIKLSLQKYQSR